MDKKKSGKKQFIRRLIFLIIGLVCIFVGVFLEINRYNWRALSIFFLIIPGSIFVLNSLNRFIIYFVKRYKLYSVFYTDSLGTKEKSVLLARRRKENRMAIVFAISIVLLVVSASLIGVYIPKYNEKQWIYANSEIAILKDSDFSERNSFPGSGTTDDPYLIKDLVIKTDRMYGIHLVDISAHFIIRNCTIEAGAVGIALLDSADNIGKILNNTINVVNSSEGSVNGISISSTHGTTISNNRCISPTKTTLYSNSIGISLYNSIGCFITGNICENLSIGIRCTGELVNLLISGNTCNNNFNKGIDIYEWTRHSNYVSSIIGLYNNKLLNSKTGLYLNGDFTSVDIIGNNISCNTDYGIVTNLRPAFCNISYNYIHLNGFGLRVSNLWNSTISYNSFMSNTNYSIEFLDIYSGYIITNRLHHNNFISNHVEGLMIGLKQASDNSYLLNQWFDENTNEGNYWSDLVWNEGVIYQIDGWEVDSYPLENPVSI